MKTCKSLYESRTAASKARTKKEFQLRVIGDLKEAVQKDNIAGSRDLLLDTLTRMGCPYQIDEEDNSIRFEYYDNFFYAEADNEQPYVSLYYYSWGVIDLKDVEDISETKELRNAINDANWKNRVITVFNIDEEEKKMNVHGRTEILFIPEIPNLEDYLATELSRFFRAEYSVRANLFCQL